jgi:glycosyltransferase involved in cell wall biosynthesis
MEVAFLVPHLAKHDAVGNDIVISAKNLQISGITTCVFARSWDAGMEQFLTPFDRFSQFSQDPDHLVIYHHCVFFPELKGLIDKIQCQFWVRYHNITPKEFYDPYDPVATYATVEGRRQARELVRDPRVNLYLAQSEYTGSDLLAMDLDPKRLKIVPPYVRLQDFETCKEVPQITTKLKDRATNILFVGRTVPNKGHFHLLKVLEQFVSMYGSDVKLWIVGSLAPQLSKYYEELESVIAKARLNDCVEFVSGASFDELHTFYKHSQVFLLLSEHEGFCVPILEAQLHRLPIVAVDRTAIGETIGENQCVSREYDYQWLAAAVSYLTNDNDARTFISDHGLSNIARFQTEKIDELWKALINNKAHRNQNQSRL